MKKKLTAMALSACLVATMFTGCGKDNESDSATKVRDVDKMYDEIVEGVEDATTLGKYKGVEIEAAPVAEVTDAQVEEEISGWLEYFAVTFEGSVASGQATNLDYTGTVDGQEFNGGSAEGFDLTIGSGTFIEGFEEQVIGMNVGETKKIDVTFPADYTNTDLAGKAAQFEVTVNNVAGTATLTDKWVEYAAAKQAIPKDDLSEYTVDAFRAFVRTYMEENAVEEQNSEVRQKLLVLLMEETKFDNIPDDVKQEYIDEEKAYQEKNIASYYDDVASYLSEAGLTQEEYDSQIEQYALEYLENVYALKAISVKEKIKVSEKEYEKYLQKYADNYSLETVEEFEEQYSEQYGTDLFESCLLEKVLDFLVENVKVVEVEPTSGDAATAE